MNLLFGVDGKSPSGKLPFTNYRGDFVKRSKFRMDLRADGGITHNFFRGQANFPFGFGCVLLVGAYHCYPCCVPMLHVHAVY